MRRKCNTTQKNMKQISIESLRVDLGVRFDQILFWVYSLVENFNKSDLELFNYKNL
jgi:hypothetical protein